MNITLSAKQALNEWCLYALTNMQGQTIFVWCSKISNALSFKDVSINPAFDMEAPHNFHLLATYKTKREAQAAVSAWLREYGTPEINKTMRWNRKTRVLCHTTGIIYDNQLKCAKELGISQSQLSQHLRRVPGFKTINGLEFSNLPNDFANKLQPVQYPPASQA